MSLPRGAVGWYAVCDCGISWSYTLFEKFLRVRYLIGETGAKWYSGKMIQRDFSNDDAIYDVSYSN